MNLIFFFFNDTATTEIYTLSLHDALPICHRAGGRPDLRAVAGARAHRPQRHLLVPAVGPGVRRDRKSTRLNSSHANISYAVFCLKKKKTPHALALVTSSRLHTADSRSPHH